MELLKKLVSMESTSLNSVNATVQYCAEWLSERGVVGEILNNEGFHSYVAVIGEVTGSAAENRQTIILNGHLDVVSGKAGQFTPIEKEGRLYGRGTADMLSGVTAMMQAFVRLKEQEENLGCRVMLQLVPDEETGGKKGSAYLVQQGYTGDFVICTEPTNMRISIQTKGILNLEMITRGISCHACRPWEGLNAIEKGYENFKKIKDLPLLKESSEYYESSTVNLARIEGGDILNRVPDLCRMGLDIRYVPHVDPDLLVQQIKEVIDGELVVLATEPAVKTLPDNPMVVRLQESLRTVVPGADTSLTVQHGGSDGRFFSWKGIPVVELGARGAHWHGDEEYVEVDSVNQLEEILINFISRF